MTRKTVREYRGAIPPDTAERARVNSYYSPENLELAAWYGIPVTTVDDAIDMALTTASLEDGAVYRDLNPLIWNRIGSDVERHCRDAKDVQDYEREAA